MRKGLLFDFDGVLAETMEDFYRAWNFAFTEFGYSIDRQEFFLLEGTRLEDIAAIFCKNCDIPQDKIGSILEKKETYYAQDHSFKFYPGVENIISNFKKMGIPLGIVTSGMKERLQKTVPANFLSNFDTIVSKETGGKGKPYPDPYLRGAADLKLDPKECLVVENAPSGITSAKSAGSYCIAICSTLSEKYLGEADEIISSFAELLALKSVTDIQELYTKK